MISTKIQPKIEGIEIIPVTVNEEDNTVVYVVEIPKSTTAHQAAGRKYYKRYNFQSEPMLDYEIRDVMNRSSHPVIELDFEIETEEVEVNNLVPPIGLGQARTVEKTIYNTLKILARNKGVVYASYVNYYVEINRNFLEKDEYQNLRTYKKDNSGRVYAEYYGENTIRDVVGGKTLGVNFYPDYGPSRFDPILPGMHSRADKIRIIEGFNLFNEEYIEWKVYADNALPKTGRIRIADIPVTQIESK